MERASIGERARSNDPLELRAKRRYRGKAHESRKALDGVRRGFEQELRSSYTGLGHPLRWRHTVIALWFLVGAPSAYALLRGGASSRGRAGATQDA